MIDIAYFRNQLLSSANKFKSGTLPPNRQDLFLQQASIELFNEKVMSAVQGNKLDDDLNPFLKSINLPVTFPEGLNYGLTTRPADYSFFWSMRAFFAEDKDEGIKSCSCPTADNTLCIADQNQNLEETPLVQLPIVKEVQCTKVDSGRWSSVLSHRFKSPTLDNPAITQYDAGFKVAPRNLNVVTLDFYRLPATAVFGYTLLPSGYYQYDPSTSTNIEWPATVLDELLDRTMIIFSGGYLKDVEMNQYAQSQKAGRT